MTDTLQLFTGADHVTTVASEYEARLAVVRERYDAYHPEMASRRYVGDEYGEARARLRGVAKFLAGDYDATYAGPMCGGLATIEDFRVHYAADTLRAVLHHLVFAEHYAGLRDRESAMAADPYRH